MAALLHAQEIVENSHPADRTAPIPGTHKEEGTRAESRPMRSNGAGSMTPWTGWPQRTEGRSRDAIKELLQQENPSAIPIISSFGAKFNEKGETFAQWSKRMVSEPGEKV